MNAVSLEVMRRRHLRSVLAIEAQVYPKPWTHGVFADELAMARRAQRHYIVARDKNRVVGYGGLMLGVDEAHITNIAVDPTAQQMGTGSQILLELCHVARDCGCKAITLEVRVSNIAAQNMYRKFGFAPAGVRQRYYENIEDALVMWCHDVDSDEFQSRLSQIAGLFS